MKTSTRISALAVAGIAAFSLTALPMAFADDGELSDAEIAGLIFSREEERLARDLYQAFSDQYDGARPFSKIVASEQRHFDAVGRLLTQYGIDDPAAGATAGSFSDATLQGLYDQWYAQGMQSLQDAYQVGVDLETRDIADLEHELATTETTAVRTVLENPKGGSENHLAAYERAATGQQGGGQQAANGQGGYGPGAMGRQGGNTQQRQQNCDGTCDGTGQNAQQGARQGPADGTGAHGTGECPNA